MSGVIPVIPRFKFLDATGKPVASGSLTVYLAGSTTLASTYQDKALTILNTNPIPLDPDGECLFYVDGSLTYKFLLQDVLGATVPGWPVDNVLSSGAAATVPVFSVDTFSSTGAQTAFTLSTTPAGINNTEVFVAGVYQKKSAYSLAGNVLTFGAAPASGTNNIEVNTFGVTEYTSVVASIAAQIAAATAQAVAAAASRSAIDNRLYPGTFIVAPTLRPDGSAIQNGDRYINSSDGYEYIRVAGAWTNTASSVQAAAASASQSASASASAGAYPNTAGSNVPRGLTQASVGAITAGSGGTTGTFALGFSAGTGWLVYPTGTFTVAAGGVTAVAITGPGLCISATPVVPTVSFAASSGLTGAAVALTAQFLVTSGQGYWVSSTDLITLDRYLNVSGVATADPTVPSITTATEFPILTGVSPVWALADDKGNSAIEVASDGTTSLAAATIPLVNGFSVRASLRPSNMGTFDGELIFLNNSGQSLSSGPLAAITLTQEYDNVGYAAITSSPGALVALTAANCSQVTVSGPAEPPMFGALYYIKLLLEQENGLSSANQKYQLVGGDNSHGSFSIFALNKGTTNYNCAITMATSTATIAAAANLIPLAGGVLWTQGEADTGQTIAAYQAALSTLATNYNTDLKAQTGQARDIAFITYQTGSTPAGTVPQAQLAAAIANPLIHLACAMGVFEYQDNLHVTAESSKWLGCYYGLVYKRVMIDRVTWDCLRPISSIRSGNFVNVKFNVPVKPLVLDTTQLPAQSQSGFTMVDSGGTNIPITAITVVSPDTVKFAAGSAIPAGAKLRCGWAAATGKGAYVGGASNLRDSQGDSVPLFLDHRLDNWCVINEFALA